MQQRDAVFQQTLECLRYHCHPKWGDRNAVDVFNRLLAKNIRPVGWTRNTHLDIQQDQIASRQEQWPTSDLARLRRSHDRQSPLSSDAPIVLAEYMGVVHLLDGHNRINRWVSEGDNRTHLVNIHAITGTGRFVELGSLLRGV